VRIAGCSLFLFHGAFPQYLLDGTALTFLRLVCYDAVILNGRKGVLSLKSVTIRDIAQKANVSATTVSLILNGKGNGKFPEETCNRVIDASKELGYTRSRISQIGDGENKVLIAIAPTLSNLYYVNMAEAMQHRAKELGYSLLLFDTFRDKQQEACVMQICKEYPFAGIFLLYPPENSLLQHLDWDRPIIHIYDKGVQKEGDVLEIDSFQVGSIIGEYLIGLGHERIGFISASLESKQVARIRRLNGLREAYRSHGFDPLVSVTPYSPELVNLDEEIASEGYDLGYYMVEHLLKSNEDVTAFVTANDMIAIGALDAIADSGKKVPGDYSVCGCDNTSISKYRGISLTSVECYATRTGQEAVDMMIRKLKFPRSSEMTTEYHNEVTRVEYIPRLVKRKSTGPMRERNRQKNDK
jgi:LacI family transcriptional regulator